LGCSQRVVVGEVESTGWIVLLKVEPVVVLDVRQDLVDRPGVELHIQRATPREANTFNKVGECLGESVRVDARIEVRVEIVGKEVLTTANFIVREQFSNVIAELEAQLIRSERVGVGRISSLQNWMQRVVRRVCES